MTVIHTSTSSSSSYSISGTFTEAMTTWVPFTFTPTREEVMLKDRLKTDYVQVSIEEAEQQLALYKDLPTLTAHEKSLLAIYDAVIKGEKFFNLDALKVPRDQYSRPQSDLPLLAIAPVTAEVVTFQRKVSVKRRTFVSRYSSGRIPTYTFEGAVDRSFQSSDLTLSSRVPSVLPTIRDKIDPATDRIVWEASWHEEDRVTYQSVDPIVVRPVQGTICRVIAAWDLTAAEAALLAT